MTIGKKLNVLKRLIDSSKVDTGVMLDLSGVFCVGLLFFNPY